MSDAYAITILIFIAALLYSSVGHAGASGYLAVMGWYKLPQTVMRPAALVLNVFVASIGTYRFWRANLLSWRLLWPFVALSMPFAFYGGWLRLDEVMFKRVLGCVLLFAAGNLLWQGMRRKEAVGFQLSAIGSEPKAESPKPTAPNPPPIPLALLIGAGIGLLSGLTGVGGGIFLSPILILMRWADPKHTAGVSVAFILLNSIAGLAGQMYSGQFKPLQTLPWEFLMWAIAAVCGGLIGSWLGARRLSNPALRLLLGLVLVIAGAKLLG